MNKEKKTLHLGVSLLAKEIKHLDNLGGKRKKELYKAQWEKES